MRVVAVPSIGSAVLPPASYRCLWLWPNLFSLDAPAVAVLWQTLLARNLAVHLDRAEPLMLALCVWFVYLSDRVLDAWRPPECQWESGRKAFYRSHLASASAVALLAFSVILPLARRLLPPATFSGGSYLAIALLCYLALVHLGPVYWRSRWPREIAIACLFTLGTFLAVWTGNGKNAHPLWAPAILFSLLCWINCCAIETWEWQATDQCFESRPSRSTRWAAEYLVFIAMAIVLLAAIARYLTLAPAGFSAAVFLSAVALGALAVCRPRLRPTALPVAADLALCTPLLLLVFAW